MHYFLIGNATIPSTWVALVAGFIVSYLAVRFRFGKVIADTLVDAIFYFILIWKLSVIVTQFGNVIKSPLSILYFNGGRVGVILGLLGASIKIISEMNKKQLNQKCVEALFLGVVITQAVYQVIFVLVNETTILVQLVTIMSFVFFTLFVWLTIEKETYNSIQLPILFIAVHFFVTAFQSTSLFNSLTITFISLFFIFIGSWRKKQDIKSEGTL